MSVTVVTLPKDLDTKVVQPGFENLAYVIDSLRNMGIDFQGLPNRNISSTLETGRSV